MNDTEAAGTQEILEARERARLHADWYVMLSRGNFKGPFSEDEARKVVDAHRSVGRAPKLLRVVEDYE